MEETKEVFRLKKLNKNAWATMNRIKAHFITSVGGNTKTELCIPLDGKTGQLKNIFTQEERKKLAKQLNLEEADLQPNSVWLLNNPFTYQGDEIVLDPENPIDFLHIKIIQSNTSKVAFGEEELRTKANAEFILYNEQEKFKKESLKANKKGQAWALYNSMTPEEKRGILICVGKKISGASNEVIDSLLAREIEEKPEVITSLYSNEQFKEIVFIQTLIVYGILKKKREGIVDGKNGEFIGSDIEQVVTYIKDPENKLTVDALRRELKEAQK